MKLLDKAARFFGRRHELPQNAVEHTRVDRAVLNDWRKRAPKLADTFEQVPDVVTETPTWERLCEDIFYSYFGESEPHVLSRDEIDSTYQINRDIADKNARDEGFRKRRPDTHGKPFEASIATIGAMKAIAQNYDGELAEHVERQQEMAQQEQTVDELMERMGELREKRAGLTAKRSINSIDEKLRNLAGHRRAAEQRIEELQQEQQAKIGEIRAAVNRAVVGANAAAQEAVENAELVAGIGKGSGGGMNLSPDTMFGLAERIRGNRALRDCLDLLGRLEISMSSTRRQQRRGGFEEMVDIQLGNDLSAALPMEKMLLMHPVGRVEFFRRYTERALMEYEFSSEQDLKRGPIIGVVDGSASMSGARIRFAKAFGLATVNIANREKRNAAMIDVGGPGQERTYFFPKAHHIDAVTAIDYAEFFFNSGTDLETGLRKAKELIDDEAPFHSADIILISDGGDRLTDSVIALRDEFRAQGIRIHGLAIDMAPTDYLLTVCDHTSPVYEFAGPNNATDRIAIDLT